MCGQLALADLDAAHDAAGRSSNPDNGCFARHWLQTARRFLKEGAHIRGVEKDAGRLARTARELDPSGERLTVVSANLADPASAGLIAAAAEQRFAGLDVLLNNAGIQIDGSALGFVDGSEAVLRESIEVDLLAPYRLCLALLPLLRRGNEPRVANVRSGGGTFEALRQHGIAAYRLSKFALNGFTIQLARELAGQVAVNAFDPGWVKTDLGGPEAPGSPDESARAALELVTMPFSETGTFWKEGRQIPF